MYLKILLLRRTWRNDIIESKQILISGLLYSSQDHASCLVNLLQTLIFGIIVVAYK